MSDIAQKIYEGLIGANREEVEENVRRKKEKLMKSKNVMWENDLLEEYKKDINYKIKSTIGRKVKDENVR